MNGRRALADEQLLGDLPVGSPGNDQFEDLAFPRRQIEPAVHTARRFGC
jgi:hypothetical protein